MSIEPTCEFCGASDMFPCRTQKQANGCAQFPVTTPIPYFKSETLTASGPNGKLSVYTMPDESISVKREDDGVVVLYLHRDEAETLIAMLRDILK